MLSSSSHTRENAMNHDPLSGIEQTLQQLVGGQQEIIGRLDRHGERFDRIDKRLDGIDVRLDGIDGRLDGVDRRLDKLEIGQEALLEKFDWLGEKQDGLEEAMARGFKEVREEFNERLVPIETAVRRLSGAALPRDGRTSRSRPRKRTPRR